MAVISWWLFTLCLTAISVSFTLSRKCPCIEPSLCEVIKRPPGKEFFMFSTKPDVWKKTELSPGYDWSKITTIAVFREWDDDLYCFAHSKGVRVVLVSNFPMDKLNNSQVRNSWIQQKTDEALENFADGINIDIEAPVPKSSKAVTLLTKLVKNTADTFHEKIPGSQVTFDVAWSPKCIDGRCYDAKGIADAVDFLIIMAYDQQSQIKEGPCIAKANSPYLQTLNGVKEYLDLNITADKLLLGLPWYGYDYPCEVVDKNNSTCFIRQVPFRGVNCSDAAGSQVEYSTVHDLLNTRTDTGRQWNLKYMSPFFWYMDHGGNSHQVWYDDPASLSIKYIIAADKDLRGIAIWNSDLLDYGGLMRTNILTKEMWAKLNHLPGV